MQLRELDPDAGADDHAAMLIDPEVAGDRQQAEGVDRADAEALAHELDHRAGGDLGRLLEARRRGGGDHMVACLEPWPLPALALLPGHLPMPPPPALHAAPRDLPA